MSLREIVKRFARAPLEWIRDVLSKMDRRDLLRLDAVFEAWAHPSQLPPKGEHWRTWLLMAGRGFGKTRAGAEWVDALARRHEGIGIALVGATIGEARAVMVEGVSGILEVAANKRKTVDWEPSLGRLRWPNGSVAELFSGDHADGLRGPEHDVAWGSPASGHHPGGMCGGAAPVDAAIRSGVGSILPGRRWCPWGVVGF